MKKLPDNFSVYAKTLEEAKYITEKQKELCKLGSYQSPGYFRFDITNQDSGRSSSSYINDVFLRQAYDITQEFTFEEFKSYFEEPSIPNFRVKGTKLPLINENIEFKARFWNNFRQNSTEYSCREYQQYSFGHEVVNGVTYILSDRLECKATNYWMFKEEDLIRLYKEQNNIEDMNEDKQIIGYKLIKPEYTGAIKELTKGLTFKNEIDTIGFSIVISILKKAGVLDLWFKPIYEVKEEIISINGQFNLKVKDKRVFHENEDITDYVKSIGIWWENIMLSGNLKFGKYDFLIPSHNIKLMKTGCQTKETNLENWLKIYNLIK